MAGCAEQVPPEKLEANDPFLVTKSSQVVDFMRTVQNHKDLMCSLINIADMYYNIHTCLIQRSVELCIGEYGIKFQNDVGCTVANFMNILNI